MQWTLPLSIRILTYRYIYLYRILVGIVNAISITALNYVYKYLSVVLVNWENHRYEEQWDNSYTVKNFALQFVNTYISLFAIAFYDKNMEKVAINLAAILIVKQFAMNILVCILIYSYILHRKS